MNLERRTPNPNPNFEHRTEPEHELRSENLEVRTLSAGSVRGLRVVLAEDRERGLA